ncbi:TlpA disulfide reductase family protein [Fibrella aestuarina]|nr:TlpA disulfide reductase family protein [Fibrella aestuarina]
MKKSIGVGLLLLTLSASAQTTPFVLHGRLDQSPAKWIYLKYVDRTGEEKLDSAQITQGAFIFTGQLSQPTKALIKTNRTIIPDEENLNIALIFLEPTTMQVKAVHNQFRSLTLKGSKTHDEFNRLTALHAPYLKQYFSLRERSAQLAKQSPQTGDGDSRQSQQDSINQAIVANAVAKRLVSYRFIEDNPNSWASAYELDFFKSTWPVDSVRRLYGRLNPNIQESLIGQRIAEKITMLDQANTAVGTIAADFSAIDASGHPIRLADYKGRYVLLDFWGSWCAPCRAGNPHLRKLYQAYRQKGIEFIGIACEDKPVAWRTAIEKDSIGVWKHILDTEMKGDRVVGSQKSIARKYAVDSFPTKVLIDPKGVIVGRYNGGNDSQLDEKLKDVLGN